MLASTALLRGLIDYAGLFPPAALDMTTAVERYNTYRRSGQAWMPGRLVVPAARLGEFETARQGLRVDVAPGPWRVSALLGADLDADAEAALAFARGAAAARLPVIVDAWEARVAAADDIFRLSARVPGDVRISFEIPVQASARAARASLLAAIFHAGGTAKARTGGVTATMIPTTADLAAFLWDCARARVPFKATAGLHHGVRGAYPLTYEPDSPSAVMHGFLNVFVAAALARLTAGPQEETPDDPPAVLSAILEERDPASFVVRGETIRWRVLELGVRDVDDMRSSFGVSFGSCSFEEPVEELIRTCVIKPTAPTP